MQDEPEPPKAKVKEEEEVKGDKDETKKEKEESTKKEDHKEDAPEEIKDLKDIKNQTDAKPEVEDVKSSETKPESGNISEKASPTKPVAKDAKASAKMIAVEEYLVKFKNFSYLHCQWLTEQELTRGDKRINQKIKRFQQKREKSGNVLDFCEEEPFNPDYVEVDRVLDASEHTDEQTKVSLINNHHQNYVKEELQSQRSLWWIPFHLGSAACDVTGGKHGPACTRKQLATMPKPMLPSSIIANTPSHLSLTYQ